METAITVTGLKKAFKDNVVLKGVDFTVHSGSIFALLGSNGAGKTTIINILTTLVKADAGVAVVAGFDVVTQPALVRSNISLTGQFAAVDDILTARENLELIADLRHDGSSARTANDLLEKFGLADAADRRVLTFSGGMRRRLDIAMSLIGSPAIIFLDEPTTGLDPEARNEMWRTIRMLAQNGTTVLLTTQYLDEADELADTIALLHTGKIVAIGTAAELKKLVPSGHIQFTFAKRLEMETAKGVLEKTNPVSKGDGFTLIVEAGKSTSEMATIFISLRDAKINAADFSLKMPTLDDVFFKLTSNNKEEEKS